MQPFLSSQGGGLQLTLSVQHRGTSGRRIASAMMVSNDQEHGHFSVGIWDAVFFVPGQHQVKKPRLPESTFPV